MGLPEAAAPPPPMLLLMLLVLLVLPMAPASSAVPGVPAPPAATEAGRASRISMTGRVRVGGGAVPVASLIIPVSVPDQPDSLFCGAAATDTTSAWRVRVRVVRAHTETVQ